MKLLLIGINAKYIHPNLAIRLLKANCRYDVDIKEFNIKDSIDSIYQYSSSYDIIGISSYIWNIEIVKSLATRLKQNNKIVVLGGPEVSYNATYYIENNMADYVIKNEGEEAFDYLMAHIIDNSYKIDEIPNLYHKNGYTFDKYVDLGKSKMAYDLLDDVKNQIVYIESSRGCPYKCAYCMASLDNKVRFFNTEEIKRQIKILIEREARVFKFLDRTFNANKKSFISIIDFIIENHRPNNSFQFEITGDLLDQDVIEYINERAPKNLFRFEIGIQSTNIKANLAVGRIQNNEKLFNNIRLIQDKGVIDLHLDLIAGLPYEDYNSFKKTFNDVVSLRPKELQLGFLKLLHGTRLKGEAELHCYKYQSTSPYEIISNLYLSSEDIANIHITEDAFEKYYNKPYYKKTINKALDYTNNAYDFFFTLGVMYKNNKPKSLEDSYLLLDSFLKDFNEYQILHEELIIEYLSFFRVKPKCFWVERIDKAIKNKLIKKLVDDKVIDINKDLLYKHSIITIINNTLIIAIYTNNSSRILTFKDYKLEA